MKLKSQKVESVGIKALLNSDTDSLLSGDFSEMATVNGIDYPVVFEDATQAGFSGMVNESIPAMLVNASSPVSVGDEVLLNGKTYVITESEPLFDGLTRYYLSLETRLAI